MQPRTVATSTRLAAAAIGVITGSLAGYMTGIMGEHWPGPPYLPYMALVSIPPGLVFIMLLSDRIRDILLPPSLRTILPSFGGVFVIMYGMAFAYSYWIRI